MDIILIGIGYLLFYGAVLLLAICGILWFIKTAIEIVFGGPDNTEY